MTDSGQPATIVWFRRDLRTTDNPALLRAVAAGGPVLPVFVWSPAEDGDWRPGRASRWWLRRSLERLDEDLRRLGNRENFVSRVFAHQRWMDAHRERFTRRALTDFHARHKFVLMAHNQQGMRRLGRLLGQYRDYDNTQALAEAYWDGFSEVMKRTPTRRNHTNTLNHIAGFVSDQLDAGDRRELADTIERYRLERLPLIVPVTLLRHYVRRLGQPYLESQVYLNPHPDELMLLNQL